MRFVHGETVRRLLADRARSRLALGHGAGGTDDPATTTQTRQPIPAPRRARPATTSSWTPPSGARQPGRRAAMSREGYRRGTNFTRATPTRRLNGTCAGDRRDLGGSSSTHARPRRVADVCQRPHLGGIIDRALKVHQRVDRDNRGLLMGKGICSESRHSPAGSHSAAVKLPTGKSVVGPTARQSAGDRSIEQGIREDGRVWVG